MNAYLFASVVTCSRLGPAGRGYSSVNTPQTWDSCSNQIVFARSLDEARRQFETWLNTPQPSDEEPVAIRVRKIAAAPFVDRLLTESGNLPLDWPQVAQQVQAQLESAPVDDFEQGYWVEVDGVVPADKLSFNVETLQRDLPDDIRSGLNWSEQKKFFFVVSVLAPFVPPPPPGFEAESDDRVEGEPEEESDLPEPVGIEELYNTFPQALDKEAAVLIRARNSVVAAWLWRRHAANGPLAKKAIRIDPWCEAINPK